MAEYIKREATCKDCFHYCVCKDTVADENWKEDAPKEVREIFSPKGCKNYVPAADVVGVRYGEWIKLKDYFAQCSECGLADFTFIEADEFYNYCPNCGAKMDGGEKKNG